MWLFGHVFDTQHTNEMLQNWSVAARFVSPGPHFSQGRLRAEEPLRSWQLTVTGNELFYSTSEITNTSLNDFFYCCTVHYGIYILFTHQQMRYLLNLEKFKFI